MQAIKTMFVKLVTYAMLVMFAMIVIVLVVTKEVLSAIASIVIKVLFVIVYLFCDTVYKR